MIDNSNSEKKQSQIITSLGNLEIKIKRVNELINKIDNLFSSVLKDRIPKCKPEGKDQLALVGLARSIESINEELNSIVENLESIVNRCEL